MSTAYLPRPIQPRTARAQPAVRRSCGGGRWPSWSPPRRGLELTQRPKGDRHDPLGSGPAKLTPDHRERPARAAAIVEQQAGAGRGLRRDLERAAHVGGLLRGVRHLALGRPLRDARDEFHVRTSSAAASRLASRGIVSPRRTDGTVVIHAIGQGQRRARAGSRAISASALTTSSSNVPAFSPRSTAGHQPPSPKRASAHPGSSRTSSGILRIAPSASGAIFLTSSVTGVERRCRAAASTSAGSGARANRGPAQTEQRPQSLAAGSSSSSCRTRIRQRPSVPNAAIAACSARRSAVTSAYRGAS